MNVASERFYRLVPRGGAGLACDAEGVALGALNLVRTRVDAGGVRYCEARSPDEIGQALRAAYGPQPDEVVLRLHRGLRRAAPGSKPTIFASPASRPCCSASRI